MQEIDELKLMFEVPRLHLSKFFDNIRTEIDISYAKKELNESDTNLKLEINKNWTQLIDRVNKFEADCFKLKKTNDFNMDFKQKIDEKFKLLLPINNTDHIISYIKFLIEKTIFNNKTIMYLNREQMNNNKNIDVNTIAGRVVIVTNEYLGSNLVEYLKNNQLYSINNKIKLLENEVIKLKELHNLIEDSSSLICEIELNFSNINKIHFNYNGLKNINGSYMFDSFKHLTCIYLGHNNLTEIDDFSFSSLKNLTLIELSWNQLIRLDKNVFKDLSNLKQLFLHGNKLENLDKDIFKDLKSLNFISLFSNKLTFIDANIFSDLFYLSRVEMHLNQFKSKKLKLKLETNIRFISFRNSFKNNINSIIKPV